MNPYYPQYDEIEAARKVAQILGASSSAAQAVRIYEDCLKENKTPLMHNTGTGWRTYHHVAQGDIKESPDAN
jgi:hypothetical protein